MPETLDTDESPTLGKLGAALAKAQGAIENAARETLNANPNINKRYADLGSVWNACRKALAENELAVVQRVTADGEEVAITTMLIHSSGEFLRDRLVVRVSPIGNQPWIQALGVSITYARRYMLQAIVGVASAAEDTDGEGATAEPAEPRQPRSSGAPTTFPNFGKWRGATIAGAPVEALETYLEAARKSLANPEKARYHAKESALIGAIEAELARQRGSVTSPKPAVDVYEEAAKMIQSADSMSRVSAVLRRAFDSGKLNADQRKALDGLADRKVQSLKAPQTGELPDGAADALRGSNDISDDAPF